jgi:hypothetical protein
MKLEIQRHRGNELLLRWLDEAGTEVSFCYLHLPKDDRQTVPVPATKAVQAILDVRDVFVVDEPQTCEACQNAPCDLETCGTEDYPHTSVDGGWIEQKSGADVIEAVTQILDSYGFGPAKKEAK